MKIIVQQVLILYIFLVCGWLLGKKDKEQASRKSVLSFLLVNFFLPCKIIQTFSEKFSVSYLKANGDNILIALGFVIGMHFISLVITRWFTKEQYAKKVFQYSFVISNYAYMGYGLIEGIYGSDVLMDFIVFCIPFSIYIYTIGYAMLTGKERSFKNLCNPLMISIVIGIVLGLLEVKFPVVINNVMSGAASCLSPVSMILTGMTLSTLQIKDLIKDKASYIFVLLRLLALPALVALVCKLLGAEDVMRLAVIYAALPGGMNVVVFANLVGEDTKPGARLVFLSNLFSCITIPICIALLL